MIDNMLNKQCIICNKTFFKAPTKSKTEWNKMKFCSKKCYWTSPHKKISTVDKTCPECNQTFSRKPKESIKQWGKKKFCSFHCNGKATLRGHKVWNKGKEWPEETKKRLRTARLGKKHKTETRLKMSFAHSGAKNHNYIDGRTRNSGKHYNDLRWKLWREIIFARDNWICQNCFKQGGKLEPHHIKGWAKFPNLRYEIENGTTLCRNCHKKTDNYCGKKSQVN